MVQFNFPIAESLPDPIFIVSAETQKIVWMNNGAEVWLRQPLSAVLGKSMDDIGNGFDEVETQLKNDLGPTTSYRGIDLHVNVRRMDYECRYQIFNCPSGIAIHFDPKEQGFSSPVSQGPDQSVTMLGKMLAHELKNPLAGIRGAAQLLESDLASADDRELTSLIKTEVDRIGRLTERLEGFGQSNFSDFKPFNIHEVLRKATLLFGNQTSPNLEIVESFDPSLPDVVGDTDGIMQVVVNLVSNAIDAIRSSENDGRIELKTGYRTGIHRRSAEGEKRSLPVQVQIIDNGPGIPPQLRDRIFQPFVTGKVNGQGLGLALISKIVDDHGGLIEANSEPGRTVFTVLLPVSPQKPNEIEL
jgi:two-component system nitrogen regulation sensor histidine kinase GlnL